MSRELGYNKIGNIDTSLYQHTLYISGKQNTL